MKKRDVMINYLLLCVEQADWHGVSDAANDLRVMEASGITDEEATLFVKD